MSDEAFLSRWARRKALVRAGVVVEPLPVAPSPPAPHPPSTSSGQAKPLPAGERESATAERESSTTAEETSLSRPGRGTEGEGEDQAPPPPTMDDVAELTPSSDYTRFLTPQVDESVKRAAMKKLFTDPHFNVMDGLDTYIDDYGKPDPIPESMLRRMVQAEFLGLFKEEDKEEGRKEEPDAEPKASPDGAAPPAVPQSPMDPEAVPPDENADLRLQQDDAAGPGGTGQGPAA